MSNDVTITYINRTRNTEKPSVAVFLKNTTGGYENSSCSLAWRVFENIGYLSSSRFVFPVQSEVRGLWGNGNSTSRLQAEPGITFTAKEEQSGIVMAAVGPGLKKNAMEIHNNIRVDGGLRAQLLKSGKPLLEKRVAYNQKATFILSRKLYLQPKLYWGLAEGIREGQKIDEGIFISNAPFQMDIDGITRATVALIGTSMSGYRFEVEEFS